MLLTCLAGQAQTTQVLRGRVLDAETRQPVPNAQVGVAGNRIGTSTNDDGRFVLSIPPAYQHEQLEVALLGYRKYSQALPPLPGPELLVELRLSPAALGEVQVTASVEGIVREAVARIPRNYPVRPSTLTGFYRESDYDPSGKVRYLAEGVVTVYKVGYQRATAEGDVQVRAARKVDLRPKQAVLVDWAGGSSISHYADFVHTRAQFLQPKHMRDYQYALAPGSSFQERPVYVVTFAPRPGNRRAELEGRLYIDQDSYAILGADWHYTAAALAHGLRPADSRQLRVRYQPYAGRWHLKSVWWQTKARPPIGPPLHYFGEFLTTAIDTAQTARPSYVERAQRHDVFLQSAVADDSAFWQSHTTLLPPDSLRRALLDQQRQRRADSLFARPAPAAGPQAAAAPAAPAESRLFRLLSRLRYGAAVGAWPVTTTAGGLVLDYAPAGGFRAQGSTQVEPSGFTGWWRGEYLADLTPRLAARLATRRLFGQFRGEGWELGLSYQHNLNPRRRPVFARAGLAFSRQAVAHSFGTFDNQGRVAANGTALTADRLAVQLQAVTDAVLPTAGLGLELSHKFELIADVGYLVHLNTRTQLQLDEKSGFFLGRSSAALALPNSEAGMQLNQQPTTGLPWRTQHWLLSFGLLYKLR